MIFYSPSTGGFYPAAIFGRRAGRRGIPRDALRISTERHAELLAAQAAGAQIAPGPDGLPEAQAARAVDPREALIAIVKREARRRILAIAPAWRQRNDSADIAMAALQLHAGMTTNIDPAPALERRAAVDAIRAASNRLELEIHALEAAELEAFDPALDMHWEP